MLTGLAKKIFLVISYTDQFNFPLTKNEILLRIIGGLGFSENALGFLENPPDIFDQALKNLISKKYISQQRGFYFLSGREKILADRAQANILSEQKWAETRKFIDLVKKIPWIKGVAVTGALAVNNVSENDDIDFMIITQANRLWLARVVVGILVFFKGKKRSWNGNEKNSWCLNLWLDQDSLILPERLRSIYGAHEVCQAVWLLDRENTKNIFFRLNSWSKKYLPHFYNYQQNNQKKLMISDSLIESSARNSTRNPIFVNFLNKFAYYLQFAYMKRHMTKEKVGLGFAFFHPRDTKNKIYSNWIKEQRIFHD